jgi:hypothetical protein
LQMRECCCWNGIRKYPGVVGDHNEWFGTVGIIDIISCIVAIRSLRRRRGSMKSLAISEQILHKVVHHQRYHHGCILVDCICISSIDYSQVVWNCVTSEKSRRAVKITSKIRRIVLDIVHTL